MELRAHFFAATRTPCPTISEGVKARTELHCTAYELAIRPNQKDCQEKKRADSYGPNDESLWAQLLQMQRDVLLFWWLLRQEPTPIPRIGHRHPPADICEFVWHPPLRPWTQGTD